MQAFLPQLFPLKLSQYPFSHGLPALEKLILWALPDQALCSLAEELAADADLRFMARLLALCSPPLTTPATRRNTSASRDVLQLWPAAAKRLFRKARSDPSHVHPRVINTDQARLYGSAIPAVKEEGILGCFLGFVSCLIYSQ